MDITAEAEEPTEEPAEESMAMDITAEAEEPTEEPKEKPKAAQPAVPKKRKKVKRKLPSFEEEPEDGEKNIDNFQSWLQKMQRGPKQ